MDVTRLQWTGVTIVIIVLLFVSVVITYAATSCGMVCARFCLHDADDDEEDDLDRFQVLHIPEIICGCDTCYYIVDDNAPKRRTLCCECGEVTRGVHIVCHPHGQCYMCMHCTWTQIIQSRRVRVIESFQALQASVSDEHGVCTLIHEYLHEPSETIADVVDITQEIADADPLLQHLNPPPRRSERIRSRRR